MGGVWEREGEGREREGEKERERGVLYKESMNLVHCNSFKLPLDCLEQLIDIKLLPCYCNFFITHSAQITFPVLTNKSICKKLVQ